MPASNLKRPSLFTAIAIGVGSMIGSGWLFAAYYASKAAGSISLLSWCISAGLVLILAFMLAEISTRHHSRSLFSRLLTISHNRDLGFVLAISNWLGLVITIPSEAEATIQYISTLSPKFEPYIFQNHHLTYLGIALTCALMLLYGCINYWGIRSLAKVNNIITVFKIIIPLATAIILIIDSFTPSNFTAYRHTFTPYGIGPAFGAVVTAGIFYAFYGFGMIAVYGAELKNPKRNIPIALVVSVVLCLIIYLLLQTAFIGALPVDMIMKGWHQLNFTSPLAQLLLLLNLNFWAIVLYLDACVSPSGTAIIYTGSASRNFTGMAEDQQMPQFFNALHPIYNISRRSLLLTLAMCICMVVFFRNWQKIMIVVTVFQLITCVAIPISFVKLRQTETKDTASFRVPFGRVLAIAIYLLITYLLVQAGTNALVLSLVLHVILFTVYTLSQYKGNTGRVIAAFQSSWTIFLYLAFTTVFGYLNTIHMMRHIWVDIVFIALSIPLYFMILHQKNTNTTSDTI